LLSITLTICK